MSESDNPATASSPSADAPLPATGQAANPATTHASQAHTSQAHAQQGHAAHGHRCHQHAHLDLEAFLPYRLSVLSNRISQTIANLYGRRFGLAITEWRVMAVLGRFSGLSASEVAERTAMDKVAVSRAVARLLERGLIERETHGDDRRRSVLGLSEIGYGVYDEVAPMTLECERQLLVPLDPAERQQLDALLAKLGTGLEHMRGQR